jgi:hypothetical protein
LKCGDLMGSSTTVTGKGWCGQAALESRSRRRRRGGILKGPTKTGEREGGPGLVSTWRREKEGEGGLVRWRVVRWARGHSKGAAVKTV